MKAKVIWISIIVAILGLPVIFYGTMLILVQVNPVSIEPNYTENAANWDANRREEQRSDALEWTMDMQTIPSDRPDQVDVIVSLFDRYGKPIFDATVDLSAFHNAQASNVIEQTLPIAEGGMYRATLPMRRSGQWVFTITAKRNDDMYKKTIRQNVIVPTRR